MTEYQLTLFTGEMSRKNDVAYVFDKMVIIAT